VSRSRALILDVEGVIAHPLLSRADRELAELVGDLSWQTLDAARNRPGRYNDWVVYSVGLLDPDEYWRRVLESADAPSDPHVVAGLRAIMRRVWWGRLDEEVLQVARAARASGLLLGLLSNSAPEHDERAAELAAHADRAHFSHLTGRRKPDAAAYEAIASDLGVAPKACVFVDDKTRNVDAARAVGMVAFRFTDTPTLITRLAAKGIHLPGSPDINSPRPSPAPSAGRSAAR
jgi:HAD superfamily hydrolase (TIGR01509 family)